MAVPAAQALGWLVSAVNQHYLRYTVSESVTYASATTPPAMFLELTVPSVVRLALPVSTKCSVFDVAKANFLLFARLVINDGSAYEPVVSTIFAAVVTPFTLVVLSVPRNRTTTEATAESVPPVMLAELMVPPTVDYW